MKTREIVEGLKKRPRMFLSVVTFDTIVAYLSGYDLAVMGGLLLGFHEWLVVRVGRGENVVWDRLVDISFEASAGTHNDDARIAHLFAW